MPTDRNLIKREVATYAEVLLEAVKDEKDEKKIFLVEGQLDDAISAIRGNMEFRSALEDRTLEGKTRSDIAAEVFKDFDPCLVRVIALMAERDEIDLLPRVKEDYSALAEEATKTVMVDVTTVVTLTDELREEIKKKLASSFEGKRIVLREHIDPSILGGIIISAHGQRIDASAQTQLEHARVVLSTVPGGEC